MVIKCQERNHEKNWLLISVEQDISQDISHDVSQDLYFYFSATFEITENIS